MEKPAPSQTASPADLDTIMQRIRQTVQQRAHVDPAAPLPAGGDGNLLGHLEVLLREQSSANETMLESFSQIVGELRELQEHARRLGDARAQDSDRQADEIRELQDELERSSGATTAVAKELEAVTSRLYQFEPSVDAEIAKVRLALREIITSTTSELREEMRAQQVAVEARLDEMRDTVAASHKHEIQTALAQQAKTLLGQSSSAMEDESRKLAERLSAQIHEAVAQQTDTISGLQAEIDQRLAQLEARAQQTAEASAASASTVEELRRWTAEAHGGLLAQLSDTSEAMATHRATTEERNAADVARLTQLESATSDISAALAALHETAAQLRSASLAQTAAQNERLHQLNAVLMAEIASLQHRIDGIAAAERNEQLARTLQELSARIEAEEQALEERAQASEHRVTALEAAAEERDVTAVARLTQLEVAMSELTSGVGATQETASGISSELRSLIASHQERLDQFDSSVAAELTRLSEQIAGINAPELTASVHALTERLNAAETALREQISNVRETLGPLNAIPDELGAAAAKLSAIETAVSQQRNELEEQIEQVGARLSKFEDSQFAREHIATACAEPLGVESTAADVSPEHALYLDLFRGCKQVLDLRAGRGEFVQWLAQHGIQARGVEVDSEMVRAGQQQGIAITRAEFLHYLPVLGDNSIDAIAAFGLVQHLALDAIKTLAQLCAKKLVPGGLLVVETINPNCPLALSNFFIEPAHVQPYAAATLAETFEGGGLEVQFARYTSPVPTSSAPESIDLAVDASTDVSDYQHYALVAKKPAATAGANQPGNG